MALSDPALAAISPLQPHEIGDANALVREAGWIGETVIARDGLTLEVGVG